MDISETKKAAILSGRQLGYRGEHIQVDGSEHFVSIAIQKFDSIFKVYALTIPEECLDPDSLDARVAGFNSLEVALGFLSAELNTRLEDLNPLKGSKIFDPSEPCTE